MGADMHYREDDLLRRKGQAIGGRAWVVVAITPKGRVRVYGPSTMHEARKQKAACEGSTYKAVSVHKMRGPLVAIIEENQP